MNLIFINLKFSQTIFISPKGLGDSWGCKSPNPLESSIRELGGNILQVCAYENFIKNISI